MKHNKILISGGAGFIGSHLSRSILAMGNDITVLDDLSSGLRANLPDTPQLNFVQGDVKDFQLVRELATQTDIIFHLAEYIPNSNDFGPGHVVKFSAENPLLHFELNVKGTLNIVEAAREHGSKVIFASSSAVYGNSASIPMNEDDRVVPSSPYGASKYTEEIFCNLYHSLYGVPTIIVRFFNVFGPRQRKYVMYDILSRLKTSPDFLTMLGTGKQRRDFIFVQDAVDALLYLSSNDEANGQTYNIGTGVSTSIAEIVSYITDILGVHPAVTFTGSSWKGDIDELVADTTKLSKLGFKAETELSVGLQQFISWYHEEHGQ